MKKPIKKVEKVELPDGIKAEYLKYPDYKNKDEGHLVDTLVFLHSDRIGWVVGTLWINQRQNRTYATDINGKIYTCGNPSTNILYAHVTEKRAKDPKVAKWLEAKRKGLEGAGNIRDRIGSRRAQGQVMRAEGRTSWMWDK